MAKIDVVITSRERDLGGFTVRRILPYAHREMVGPFIFFDHMGPVCFEPGKGIDVRPHPHINLATVTYLFDGVIRHRDSLGSDQLIEPGAINWMIAGHGIVHSERTPTEIRKTKHNLNGIQCWVALPLDKEEVPPSFAHHPAESLPQFNIKNVELKLLLGQAFGYTSPVAVLSNLFYLSAKLARNHELTFPADQREVAIYVLKGEVRIDDESIPQYSMAILHPCTTVTIEATVDADIMLLGGEPLGKRYIFWNFVASSEEKIAVAKNQWRNGPSNDRFPIIPGDQNEYIPLPEEKHETNPKGTIM